MRICVFNIFNNQYAKKTQQNISKYSIMKYDLSIQIVISIVYLAVIKINIALKEHDFLISIIQARIKLWGIRKNCFVDTV